jgi:hypothetical protein
MLDNLSEASRLAIEAADRAVAEKSTDDISVGDKWFARICKGLFTSKAGTACHYDSGVDERSCQRYAAGTVQPSGWFIRALLRSKNGWTWLCAFMDGCDALWWRELQEERRVGRAAIEAMKNSQP